MKQLPLGVVKSNGRRLLDQVLEFVSETSHLLLYLLESRTRSVVLSDPTASPFSSLLELVLFLLLLLLLQSTILALHVRIHLDQHPVQVRAELLHRSIPGVQVSLQSRSGARILFLDLHALVLDDVHIQDVVLLEPLLELCELF